jgi:hypothetical protein
MVVRCIRNPYGAAKAVSKISAEIEELGCQINIESDVQELNSTRIAVRGDAVSPFFDPEVAGLDPDRFFWMKLTSTDGKVVGMQAYRYDYVDTSLADWGPTLTIGLAMRRQELMIPTHSAPPESSVAERIRGKLVFHGEFWIDPHMRNRKLLDSFSRLGMILSYLKWNPDAVWALSSNRMATHGHPNRMGYTYMERGFLRWQWATDGIDLVEWLNIAERHSIEQMLNEMSG